MNMWRPCRSSRYMRQSCMGPPAKASLARHGPGPFREHLSYGTTCSFVNKCLSQDVTFPAGLAVSRYLYLLTFTHLDPLTTFLSLNASPTVNSAPRRCLARSNRRQQSPSPVDDAVLTRRTPFLLSSARSPVRPPFFADRLMCTRLPRIQKRLRSRPRRTRETG